MTSASPSAAKRTVRVDLGDRSYDILIGPGLIATAAGEIAARLKGRGMAVITDEHVAPLYLEPLMASLKAKEDGGCSLLSCLPVKRARASNI